MLSPRTDHKMWKKKIFKDIVKENFIAIEISQICQLNGHIQHGSGIIDLKQWTKKHILIMFLKSKHKEKVIWGSSQKDNR